MEEGAGELILNILAVPFRHISAPYQLSDTENKYHSINKKLKNFPHDRYAVPMGVLLTARKIQHDMT